MARPVYGPEFAGGFRAVFEALCSAWASTCFSRVRRTPKSSGHMATPETKGNRWNRRSLLIHRHHDDKGVEVVNAPGLLDAAPGRGRRAALPVEQLGRFRLLWGYGHLAS